MDSNSLTQFAGAVASGAVRVVDLTFTLSPDFPVIVLSSRGATAADTAELMAELGQRAARLVEVGQRRDHPIITPAPIGIAIQDTQIADVVAAAMPFISPREDECTRAATRKDCFNLPFQSRGLNFLSVTATVETNFCEHQRPRARQILQAS